MAKFLTVVLLVCAATGICYAKLYPITSDGEHISMNEDQVKAGKSMFDRIIDLALKKLKASVVEPIVLQDEILLFNKSMLSIPFRGELALYNGGLWGVREIQRSGDAHFTYHNLHDVEVKCSFYFENLIFQYDFQADIYNKISTDGKINGNIEQLRADANLDVDLRNKSIELTSLVLKTAKSINVNLESEKFIDKLINLVIKLITSNFKSTILTQIQKELQSLLKQKFYY